MKFTVLLDKRQTPSLLLLKQAPPEETRGDVITTVLNGPLNVDALHYGDLAKLKSNLSSRKNKNGRENREGIQFWFI